MKEKIKTQKGFIQIPLLIIVIASIIVASVGAGIVLHKQGKLSPFVASISKTFKGTEETKPIEEEELKPEELQVEQTFEESQPKGISEEENQLELQTETQFETQTQLKVERAEEPQPGPELESQLGVTLESQPETQSSQEEAEKPEAVSEVVTEQSSDGQELENQPHAEQSPTMNYRGLHCPKIIKVEDSLGNVFTNAEYGSKHGAFRKGSIDTLTITVTATDPQGLPLYYMFQIAELIPSSFRTEWSRENTYTLPVSDVIVAANRTIWLYIDNRDGYGCLTADFDATLPFGYDIMP
ncbi:MAG: hypothetical protein ACKKMV_00340 [Candidatus Nealsonbacteria bacterium]